MTEDIDDDRARRWQRLAAITKWNGGYDVMACDDSLMHVDDGERNDDEPQ
jgi:hypothetical protein